MKSQDDPGVEAALRESEERYRAFVRNSAEAIWRFELEEPLNPAGQAEDAQIAHFYRHAYLAECNDVMARMYGLTEAREIVGVRLPELLPAERAENVEYLRAFIRSGYRLADAGTVERDRHGQTRHFLNNLVGIFDGGRLLRAWGTQRDVTGQKLVEAALRESEERLRMALEATELGTWEWNPETDGLQCSERCKSLFGLTPDTPVDLSRFEARIHPDDRARVQQAVNAAVDPRGSGEYEAEFRVMWADGQVRRVVAKGRAFFEEHAGRRRATRFIGTALDVTERRRAQEEREQALAALRENEARQRAFLRDVLSSVSEGRLCLCDTAAGLPAPLAPVGDPVPVQPGSLSAVRARAREAATDLGFDEDRLFDLLSAVGEAAMNAVVHAGGGRAEVYTDRHDTVQVWIEDQGGGIAMESLPRAAFERGYTTAGTMGHGFFLMLKTADRVHLLTTPSGTTVVLEQHADPPVPVWLERAGALTA